MRYHSIPTSKPGNGKHLAGRSGRDWQKEDALTRGDLGDRCLPATKKSAEAIVVTGNEPT